MRLAVIGGCGVTHQEVKERDEVVSPHPVEEERGEAAEKELRANDGAEDHGATSSAAGERLA